MFMFEWVLYFILTPIMMVLLHETAHQKVLRSYGRDAVLHWEKGSIVCGTHASYEGLTNKQLYEIYSMGVYAGFIPIVFACVLFHPIFILLVLPYIGWCWHDLKNMRRCRR